MQKEGQNKLYHVIKDYIPKAVFAKKNRAKTWLYGYNEKYDIVIISKTGEIENVIDINGLKIALPKPPKNIYTRSKEKKDQLWSVQLLGWPMDTIGPQKKIMKSKTLDWKKVKGHMDAGKPQRKRSPKVLLSKML